MEIERVQEAVDGLQTAQFGYTFADIGERLTCTEAEALADLLHALDLPDWAALLIDNHADGDDDTDDMHGRCRNCNGPLARVDGNAFDGTWKHIGGDTTPPCDRPQRAAKFGDKTPCEAGSHRPDDEPGDTRRCKDCELKITWVGPEPTAWQVVTG